MFFTNVLKLTMTCCSRWWWVITAGHSAPARTPGGSSHSLGAAGTPHPRVGDRPDPSAAHVQFAGADQYSQRGAPRPLIHQLPPRRWVLNHPTFLSYYLCFMRPNSLMQGVYYFLHNHQYLNYHQYLQLNLSKSSISRTIYVRFVVLSDETITALKDFYEIIWYGLLKLGYQDSNLFQNNF